MYFARFITLSDGIAAFGMMSVLTQTVIIVRGRLGRKDMKAEIKIQLWTSLMHDAVACQSSNRLGEAEMYARAACTISRRVFGKSHHNTMVSLLLLADLLAESGAFEESADVYNEALMSLESTRGAAHPSVGLGLRNLAELYKLIGRETEAKSIDQRSKRIMADWQLLQSAS